MRDGRIACVLPVYYELGSYSTLPTWSHSLGQRGMFVALAKTHLRAFALWRTCFPTLNMSQRTLTRIRIRSHTQSLTNFLSCSTPTQSQKTVTYRVAWSSFLRLVNGMLQISAVTSVT